MYDTQTIRVPKPICVGEADSRAFVVFEYLSIGGSRGGNVGELMGRVRRRRRRRRRNGGGCRAETKCMRGRNRRRNRSVDEGDSI